MARGKSNRRAQDHSDFAGPDAEQEAIETLSNAAKKANAKAGKNVGEASDETVGMHVNLIKAAEIEWRMLRDQASQAQGVLRNRYKVAKGDGVDVDSLKLAFRISERSTGEVIAEQRNLGRYLKIMGSPLGFQWSLFDNEDADGAKLDATAQGEQAGRDGTDRDANPYTPGKPDWFAWNNGWQTGQDALIAKLGRGNGAEAAAH